MPVSVCAKCRGQSVIRTADLLLQFSPHTMLPAHLRLSTTDQKDKSSKPGKLSTKHCCSGCR